MANTGLPLLTIAMAMLLPTHTSYGQVITGDEFDGIASRVIASQGKIQSLQVSIVGKATTDVGETLARKTIYARSGEKEYCKTFWPTKPDEPDSTRYSLVLWDGQRLLSYESRAHNGAIRAKRSTDPTDPQTYSDVCRYFGHLTKGSLEELLRRVPAERWSAAWLEAGKTLTLTCDSLPRVGSHERSEWLLDASKGFMVSRYRSYWQDPKDRDKYDQVLEMVVTADKEVLPGIWIPTESHQEYRTPAFRSEQGVTTVVKDLAITDVRINDPAIEKLFTFQWPEGAQYYDYVLGCTVIPNATDEAMGGRMDEMAADMRSIADTRAEQDENEDTRPPADQGRSMGLPSEGAAPGGNGGGWGGWAATAVAIGAAIAVAVWFALSRKAARRRHA